VGRYDLGERFHGLVSRDVVPDRDPEARARPEPVVELSGEAAAMTQRAAIIVLIVLAMVCGALVMLHQGAH
jgi:hypothetical protein